MRLKCPSCGAQYEIPDTVIPQEGRDVQCSNCGHTWFQTPAIGTTPASPPPSPAPQPAQAPGVSRPVPAPEPAARRDLDPAVTDILRQEAAFEARVRKAEAAQLEIQPDLGLSEPQEVASSRARARQGETGAPDIDTPAAPEAPLPPEIAAPTWPKSRRDRLPDVEEINQTLRAATERREVRSVQASLDGDSDPQGGFRRGFVYTLCLFAVATLVYVYAPQLGQIIPELRVSLDSYVQNVDAVRVWLDGRVAALTDWGVEIMGSPAQSDTPG